jgi:hypothetical protein
VASGEGIVELAGLDATEVAGVADAGADVDSVADSKETWPQLVTDFQP